MTIEAQLSMITVVVVVDRGIILGVTGIILVVVPVFSSGVLWITKSHTSSP
jgi:hypothetical protein